MVDDHPLMLEGYKQSLVRMEDDDFSFNVATAYNCDDALYKIDSAGKTKPYHFFYFDINLPASNDNEFKSGKDLAIYAKEKFPESKIVIFTMLDDDFQLNNIMSELNPDGMLIKNDIDHEEFVHSFKQIAKGQIYYSSSIIDLLNRLNFKAYGEQLNAIDLEIINLIAKGIKTVDLPNHVNLSLSSVEKRKRNIKRALKLDKANDRELISKAKEMGIIS